MNPSSLIRYLIVLLQALLLLVVTVHAPLHGEMTIKSAPAIVMCGLAVMLLGAPAAALRASFFIGSVAIVDMGALVATTHMSGYLTMSISLGYLFTLLITAHGLPTRHVFGMALLLSFAYGFSIWRVGDAMGEQVLLIPTLFMMAAVFGGKAELTEMERRRLVEEKDKERLDTMSDALTGLPNRAQFIERVWRSVRCAQHNPDFLFAVLFVDLDGFKPINDRLGHKAGDLVLAETAKRLQACLRKGDVVGRYGGDEFILLVDHIAAKADAIRIAERILTKVKAPILVGEGVQVGASIGIAASTNLHERPEDLIRDADLAMYQAKGLGKGRYELSDQIRDTKIKYKLAMDDHAS